MYDIAILKLSSEVTLNNYIHIACLPQVSSNSYPPANSVAYVAGWGTLSYEGSSPSNLNNVRITVYNSSRCGNVTDTNDWNSQICAGEILGIY